MKKVIFIILCFIFFSVSDNFAAESIRLATTTSTYETGILDYILAPFEKKNNVSIHIISVGTGKAIKLGENGDVDIILVHARAAEDKFVNEGYGVNRRDVMYNDFVILGPQADPAGISALKDAKKALKKIYDGRYTFVSRGDDSGTDKKEKHLWAEAKLAPEGAWYLETGQGMSATLRMADEKNGYLLTDRATYLFNKNKIRLKNMVEGDNALLNPYGVIAVNPLRYPNVKYKLSMALIEWLISPECQGMINRYTVNGNKLFHAIAGN